MKKQVSILGSTGSIGVSTLDVLSRHPDDYQVYALAANRSVEALFAQCCQFKPKIAVMLDEESARQLADKLAAQQLTIEVTRRSPR